MVAFRAAASCEPTRIKEYVEDLDLALLRCEDLLARILQETGATSYTLYLGAGRNFRHDIYPKYKSSRSDKPKPRWLAQVREHLMLMHNAVLVQGIESDDAMGIAQCTSDEETVIVTNDKDLLMIPGNHYDPIKGLARTHGKLEGLKYFYQQLIQGDLTDNIPGFDGKMRPKIPQFLQPTITELWEMDNERDMLNSILSMYQGEEDRVLLSGQLLWIQQFEGDLWHIPEFHVKESN